MSLQDFDYVRIDFSTIKEKLKEELRKEAVFQDFDFEGSNINVLLDLLAYFSEMAIYYSNKVAGEAYPDTAKLYENLHRLATYVGYVPRGWEAATSKGILQLSAATTSGTTVSVYGEKPGTGFLTWGTGNTDEETGEEIRFVMSRNFYGEVPSSGQIVLDLTQGVMTEVEFTGKDIVNGKIVIPTPSLSFGYDTKWDEAQWKDIQDPSGTYYTGASATSGWTEEPIKLFVYEGTEDPGAAQKWLRVNSFQQEVGTTSKFRFYLDKWKRYTIEFDQVRGITPTEDQRIKLQAVRTLGDRGRSVSAAINLPSENFVYSHTSSAYIPNANISVSTSATSGGYEAESKESIRGQIPIHVASQDRCVTKTDYITKLQSRSDIFKANVWGETDQVSPDLDKLMYIYLVLLPEYPDTFNTNYVKTYTQNSLTLISGYTDAWKLIINEYLTPFKMMNFHMSYIAPDVFHSTFNMLVKVNRAAGIGTNLIQTTVNDKITRFFKDPSEIGFGMTFRSDALITYIQSKENNLNEDEDDRVDAIQYITIRNIVGSDTIYEPNGSNLYPQWENSYVGYQNELRNIVFRYDQIPIYNASASTIEVE